MHRKSKVYLDTSIISALFDARNPERKCLTEAFFEQKESYFLYISELTILEIDRTPESQLRMNMKNLVAHLPILSFTSDTEWLAKEYITFGAIPENQFEDAYHIALAVLHEMDFLLSWNFKHIIRRKTKDTVRMINTRSGFRQIEIMPPPELL